jgi:hypothetical protein
MHVANPKEITNTTRSAVLDPKGERGLLLQQIIDLAVRGLENMFDQEKRLFCYRIRQTPNGIVKEGLSRRYTIISLLGLHRHESRGGRSPIDIQNILATLIGAFNDMNNIGDIGLLMWLCSLASPERIDKICFKPDIKGALGKYPDWQQGKTTELAWFLAGVSHIALVSKENAHKFEDLAIQSLEVLKRNYGGKGIFGHLKKTTLGGMIRGRIGCFADQVYPIYALSTYAKAYGNQEALKMAKDCGEAICRLQGPYGQWWWHYDSVTGQVIGKYPVYSVHQDGMAPMALLALSNATGLDFSMHIYKGLEWIKGKNELGFNLVDNSRNFIWRSFYRKKYKMYYDEILGLAHIANSKTEDNDLKVLFECRPYHFGWLLYAFADKFIDSASSWRK